jgi:hypothetical protein
LYGRGRISPLLRKLLIFVGKSHEGKKKQRKRVDEKGIFVAMAEF